MTQVTYALTVAKKKDTLMGKTIEHDIQRGMNLFAPPWRLVSMPAVRARRSEGQTVATRTQR